MAETAAETASAIVRRTLRPNISRVPGKHSLRWQLDPWQIGQGRCRPAHALDTATAGASGRLFRARDQSLLPSFLRLDFEIFWCNLGLQTLETITYFHGTTAHRKGLLVELEKRGTVCVTRQQKD
ncbi:MAG: hypothetical protein AB7F78_12785 [Hyphomicrobiaceae bacterium]